MKDTLVITANFKYIGFTRDSNTDLQPRKYPGRDVIVPELKKGEKEMHS